MLCTIKKIMECKLSCYDWMNIKYEFSYFLLDILQEFILYCRIDNNSPSI